MDENKKHNTPNPHSILLSKAIVGGAGLSLPPDLEIPDGWAPIVLLVPALQVIVRVCQMCKPILDCRGMLVMAVVCGSTN